MENSKKLTPEEIVQLSNVTDKTDINLQWLLIWSEVENWYGDIQKKETARELLLRLQEKHLQQVSEKDALLKEARLLLYDAHARLEELAMMKRLSIKKNPLEIKIMDFLNRTNKTTGKEAGNDEQR